jgi:hypothetical protein
MASKQSLHTPGPISRSSSRQLTQRPVKLGFSRLALLAVVALFDTLTLRTGAPLREQAIGGDSLGGAWLAVQGAPSEELGVKPALDEAAYAGV